MKLRTDTIGHFDNPTEDIICDAVVYSGEGAHEGDLVKLMTDEDNFLCIWVGQRSAGHRLILKTGSWKQARLPGAALRRGLLSRGVAGRLAGRQAPPVIWRDVTHLRRNPYAYPDLGNIYSCFLNFIEYDSYSGQRQQFQQAESGGFVSDGPQQSQGLLHGICRFFPVFCQGGHLGQCSAILVHHLNTSNGLL